MARLKDTEINGNLVVKGDLLNKDGVDLTTAFSNPNLLINSDFRNPVNQRGQTSYSGATGGKYSIDRWRLDADALTLTVNSGYITIANSKSYGALPKQPFETPLYAGTYTISCNVLEFSGVVDFYLGDTVCDRIQNTGLNTMTVTITETVSVFKIGLGATSSVKLEYIKLEQGSIATPFVPRSYGEELALCQRYYQIVNVNNTANIMMPAVQITNTAMQGIVPIPVPLRTAPSIKLDGHYLIDSNGAWKGIGEYSFVAMSTSTVSISLTTSESITMGNARALLIQGAVSGCIELDAEIY